MKNNLEGNKKTKGKTVFKMIPFLSNWMGHGTKNDGKKPKKKNDGKQWNVMECIP